MWRRGAKRLWDGVEGRWGHRVVVGRMRTARRIVVLGMYDVRMHRYCERSVRASHLGVRFRDWHRWALDGFLLTFTLAVAALFYGWVWALA
jgi:hypothetical protein